MSADVKSQLADYGQYLRDHQESIHLFEITEPNAGLLTAGSEVDFGLDPAIDVEIEISPSEGEDIMTHKPATLLLLAAAAVVVIAGIFFAIESGSDDSLPVISDDVPVGTTATPQAIPATPEEIAARFIQARDARDAEATMSLFAPDANIDDRVSDLADYEVEYIWYEAVGWNWAEQDCVEATPISEPASVTCTYAMENDWSRALDVGPFNGSFDFDIVDGQIVAISNNFPPEFSRQAWDRFEGWVRANHLADYSLMYDDSGALSGPHLTSESMALWEQYTAEFVASEEG